MEYHKHSGWRQAAAAICIFAPAAVHAAATTSVSGLIPTIGTTSFSTTLTYEGQTRQYSVIEPKKVVAGAPAILMLHPRETTAVQMANLARVGRLAATDGVWVFLPEALNGQWHDDPSTTGSQASYADDVGFLSALMSLAVSQYGIDPKRIYAAGYSNGGFMSERLACELTDRIAGIGVVAATFRKTLLSVCRPTMALPVVLMSGTSDPVVTYTGNAIYASAAQSVQFWVNNDRCIGTPTTKIYPKPSGDATLVTLSRYGTCTSGSEMRFYSIQAGGHTWPGTPYNLGYLGNTSQAVDATLEIWSVLSAYHLP